ncbi:MAG TPA: hypothetical protein PLP81_10045, partial [Saprospiraceae bacterium]|nr:hypothetical protein [Saprospiraceae bacterium]
KDTCAQLVTSAADSATRVEQVTRYNQNIRAEAETSATQARDLAGRISVLDEKLAGYQSALISRYALLEFPMFFSLFLFMGNGDYRYLLISIAVLAVHLFLRPTKGNVCQTLNLTNLQRSEL